MKTKNGLSFFCPDKFIYLNKTPFIEYNGKTLKTSNLLNIIHDIIVKFQINTDDDYDVDDYEFNLFSKILRSRYGVFYKNYIDFLIENGFMKMTSNYFVGKKSRTYVLNWFDIDKIKRITIYDNIINKRVSRDYLRNILYSDSPIDINLRKKLVDDLKHVSINSEKSLECINILKQNGEITNDKYFKNFYSINYIKDNNLYFIFDSYGRFHTNFTVLKKEIRKNYLKIDEEEIEEIDIPNSQPFFLSRLLRDEMDISDEELKLFTELVENGMFYEYIIFHFPDYFNLNQKSNRSLVKKLTYKVLFGRNGIQSIQCQMFKQLFPKIFDIIINIKKSKGDYRYLSHVLMRMESDFIFGKVVNDIYKQIKGIRIFTVHDSITYPVKYCDKVKKIFNNHLKNY